MRGDQGITSSGHAAEMSNQAVERVSNSPVLTASYSDTIIICARTRATHDCDIWISRDIRSMCSSRFGMHSTDCDLDGITYTDPISCRIVQGSFSNFNLSARESSFHHYTTPLPFTSTLTCLSLSLIKVMKPSSSTWSSSILFVIIFLALSSRPSAKASITAWKSLLT